MSPRRLLPADVLKEIRALLPLWVGCVAVVWMGGYGEPILFRAGFLTYLLGSAALGALSIGHEYTNRTLPLLLSSPVSRRRIFAIKASVLLPMLLTLAALAMTRLPVHTAGREMKDTTIVSVLALLSSACWAPWLTMRTRNVIGGAIFALSVPAALLVGSEFVAIAVYGLGQIDKQIPQQFRMEIVWGGMLVLCAVGAVSSWRTFMSLEAIEGSQSDLRLPQLFEGGNAVSRRRHPVWNLVRKELRLQQLTFAVSALYVCGWISTMVLQPIAGIGDIEDSLLILTVVNGVIVALLSGSLASAEERHLGVLESQVLMPTPIGRQWAIKVGIVFGLCALLAVGLPAMLTLVSYGGRYFSVTVPFMASVLFLATVGLYASSVSGSGLKALLIAGPAALSIFVLIQLLGDVVLWAGRLVGAVPVSDPLGPWVIALIGAIVFMLLLGFGLGNHRSSDRSPFRIWRQILWLSGSVACVMLIALFVR
jgi:hypothetical protein